MQELFEQHVGKYAHIFLHRGYLVGKVEKASREYAVLLVKDETCYLPYNAISWVNFREELRPLPGIIGLSGGGPSR